MGLQVSEKNAELWPPPRLVRAVYELRLADSSEVWQQAALRAGQLHAASWERVCRSDAVPRGH